MRHTGWIHDFPTKTFHMLSVEILFVKMDRCLPNGKFDILEIAMNLDRLLVIRKQPMKLLLSK